MARRTLWIIVAAVAIVAVIVGAAVWLVARGEPSGGASTASSSAGATHSPMPSVRPTSTPESTPGPTSAEASCDDISTAEFDAMMTANGFVSWSTVGEQVGARPFDGFPGGAPDGQVVCRWGADPDAATDNVIDLAWAPLAAGRTVAVQEFLVDEGYERTESADGARFVHPSGGDGYLLTGTDVRWAPYADHLEYVRSPEITS